MLMLFVFVCIYVFRVGQLILADKFVQLMCTSQGKKKPISPALNVPYFPVVLFLDLRPSELFPLYTLACLWLFCFPSLDYL